MSVLIGMGDGTFAPPASYLVGNDPVFTVVADVDGDGVADLIVINKSSNTFSVLGGIGDGTFKSSIDFVAGNAPLAAVAGDFYGNGHLDLAIIDYASQSVSLPLGVGDGTFKTGRSYSAGQQPISIASGNLNGDKIPGLVVANYCGSDLSCSTAGSVAVFLPDDNGVYRLSSTYNVGAGPVSDALADVNGDGNLDIVAVNRLDKTVSILPGVGNGGFGQAITFGITSAPIAVAVGDLNKDGTPDLSILEDCGAATCTQPGSVEILIGAGDGSFQSTVSYPVGYSPTSLAIGDIDGDKKLDILVANRCGTDVTCLSPGTATVLIGDGTGKFSPLADISLGNTPSAIALGHLSGPGALDMVVSHSTDNTLAVLRGNGNGSFQARVSYPVGAAPGSAVVADFNGDGNADVAVTNLNDSTVSVLFGRGDGTLQPASALAVGSGPQTLTAIGGTVGGHASLATANGSVGSLAMGSSVTVIPNLQVRPFGVTANTTTLTATPNTMTVNPSSPVTLNVTVTGGSGTPTGTVNITGNGTPAAVCAGLVLDGTGSASCVTSALQANTTTLTATYTGDPTYATSTGTASVTVNTLHPMVSLSAVPASPSPLNTSVTFTATLAGVNFTPVAPGGTVAFSVGGTPIAGCTTVAVNASQRATCTTASLPAGVNSITATYSGDSNFNTATSAALPYAITKVSPTIGLTAAPASPSTLNTSVTFTATLAGVSFTPVTPGGTVQFSAGVTPITGCTAVSVDASQVATCTTASLPLAVNSITATYTGDINFNAATSAVLTYTITKPSPTISLTPAPSPASPSPVNTAVTFRATLAGVSFTPVAPGGTVAFFVGGTPIAGCTAAAVNASQLATCTTASLPAGVNSITTTYSGDSNFNTATSAALTYTITALHPTISFTPPPSPASPSPLNTPVTFTAALTGPALTPVVPNGTMTFMLNGTAATCIGAGSNVITVNASGNAACQIANMPPVPIPSPLSTRGTTITSWPVPERRQPIPLRRSTPRPL